MKKILALILILLSAHGICGATKYPLKIKDCRGKIITIPSQPKRIISIAPSNTEILYAIGLESSIVGVGSFCDYPPKVKKKPEVGDRTTSIERVISLKPDMVLVHGFLNRQAIPSLENHGIRVIAVDPKTIDEVVRDIRLIGKITNREKQAAQLGNRITAARNLVRQKVAGRKSKPKVLVAIQANPLWLAGPDTFVDEMIKLVGASNIGSDAKPGYNQFSTEAAVWRNPDMILGLSKGDKKFFSRGLWKSTNAGVKSRVHEVDPDIFVRPGPRLADGILTMARLAHPNAFKQ